MTLTTHAAASIVISRFFPDPTTAFTASFLLHYLMDIVPHGDEFLYFRFIKNKQDKLPPTVAAVDITLMLLLFFIFYQADTGLSLGTLAAATAGGILPDIFINLHTLARHRFREQYVGVLGKIEQAYHQALHFHYRWHMFWHFLTKRTTRFRYGIAMQVVLLLVLYWVHRFYF